MHMQNGHCMLFLGCLRCYSRIGGLYSKHVYINRAALCAWLQYSRRRTMLTHGFTSRTRLHTNMVTLAGLGCLNGHQE